MGATFAKRTPTLHLDMIYWCYMVFRVLGLHFMLEWAWLGRNGLVNFQIGWLCWTNVGIWQIEYDWPMVRIGSKMLAQHYPTLPLCHWLSGGYQVWINTLTQRWTNVHWRLVLTWPSCGGCITLGQHWPMYAYRIGFGWKFVEQTTLTQRVLNVHWRLVLILPSVWVYYVGPTSDQRMHVTSVSDKGLLKILHWPKVEPIYTGVLF